ncbi:hypothetical protein M422DRAFT_774166 [Sphaerobolus stellatus SS14]|nr:hypothetical protein M422DRAFT_774166 [Sphaerobolus stellatus SS14]
MRVLSIGLAWILSAVKDSDRERMRESRQSNHHNVVARKDTNNFKDFKEPMAVCFRRLGLKDRLPRNSIPQTFSDVPISLIGYASGILLSGYQVVADFVWSPIRTSQHQPSASASASPLVTATNSITEYIPILPMYQVADNTSPYLVQRSSPSSASASAPTVVLIGHIVGLHILLYQIARNLVNTSRPFFSNPIPPAFATIRDEDNAVLHALTEHRVFGSA